MIEFFEVMFRALTGLKLTMPNLIMIFMFFVLGYLFAKFAKNIGVVKALFLLIVGYFIATILSALLGVFSLAFALGFLSNQGMFIYRVISWAESLSEIYYSLQYRPMFEELQARERALQEEINRLREELKRQKSQRQKSSTQQKQKTNTQNSQQSHSRNQSGSQQRKSESEFDRCLKVLGLNVGRDYTQKDIKKAYRRLAMKYHPDMPTGDHQAFLQINNAMEYLMKHLD